MSIDTEIGIRHERSIAAQWAGNLLPPIAFLLGLEVAYMLVPHACETGNPLPVHLAHAGALLLALVGAGLAWREWRKSGTEWPADGAGSESSRFMAVVGLLVSGGFTLVIVALWLPTFFLSPCQ